MSHNIMATHREMHTGLSMSHNIMATYRDSHTRLKCHIILWLLTEICVLDLMSCSIVATHRNLPTRHNVM